MSAFEETPVPGSYFGKPWSRGGWCVKVVFAPPTRHAPGDGQVILFRSLRFALGLFLAARLSGVWFDPYAGVMRPAMYAYFCGWRRNLT